MRVLSPCAPQRDSEARADGSNGVGGTELPLDNEDVSKRLERIALLLADQAANPFRVRAYRRAAERIHALSRPVHELLESEGLAGLVALPDIGNALARTIQELALTGRLALLERLQGEPPTHDALLTVPGIGPELARRIHGELGIEGLAELEAAAWDGRLAALPGIGPRRLRAVRESLAGRFLRRPQGSERPEPRHAAGPPLVARDEPGVAELLDVDREYRSKAQRGTLPRIAPRRFNPTHAAWLPILHTVRGDRHYTALYSNTARAHELDATHDWVVIYRDDHGGDGQWTVLTARHGPLRGERIVLGREHENSVQTPVSSSGAGPVPAGS